MRIIIGFLAFLFVGCYTETALAPPDEGAECNMDPDKSRTEREREWLRMTPICAITSNDQVFFRENCLARHAPNGLPCKVCVGFEGCISPYLDIYCVDDKYGCQDPACPPDQPLH